MTIVQEHAAWHVSPQQYLAQRPQTHQLPAQPKSVYVTMRDGCRLAVDVYLPVGDQPAQGFPTVVIFTPYLRRFAVTDSSAEPTPNCARYPYFSDPRLLGPQPVDDDLDGVLAAEAVAEHRNNVRLHD